VKEVQERLGHSSAVMTLDIYGHLWPGDDERTRDATDRALAHVARTPGTDQTENRRSGA
jgi:integrase